MRRLSSNGRAAWARRLPWWVLLSALLHAASWLTLSSVLRAPDLELEFQLPMDVELGAAEQPSPAPSAAATAPAPAAPSTTAAEPQPASEIGRGAPDGGLADAGVHDGGAADAAIAPGPRRARGPDAGLRMPAPGDAGVASDRLPPGAQIALRVDMARVRASPLENDVRALLAAIPDWKALLEGSGIDPVAQLDRLLIATPNLQREKIVLAGRYLGGEPVVRAAVEQLAQARGVPSGWRSESGIPVATWADADETERVIALVGPAHFTISRPEDLPRVLAIASARAQGSRRGSAHKPGNHPADALLSMEDGEGLSLEVEGAAQFVRRARRGIPERLRLSVRERGQGNAMHVELRGTLTFADESQAAEARAYWTELKQRYASNTLVSLLGLAEPLDAAEIDQRERELRVALDLSAAQTRLVLGYVRELFSPPPLPP